MLADCFRVKIEFRDGLGRRFFSFKSMILPGEMSMSISISIRLGTRFWGRAVCLGLGLGTAAIALAAPKVDFNREIRPLLSDHCFACHGPDSKKIKGDLRLDVREVAVKPAKSGQVAIVPGQTEASELMRRVLTTDEDDLMPPPESHKPLSDAQKELLKRWIAQGAEYQGHWANALPVRPK